MTPGPRWFDLGWSRRDWIAFLVAATFVVLMVLFFLVLAST